jgi:hypothetical protein
LLRSAPGSSLPLLKWPSGSTRLVVAKRLDFLLAEEFELGDADPVLAGDDAVERPRQRHDALDHRIGGLQHLVVIRVDRNVGMHVAVTGVHVQGDEQAAAQRLLVDRGDPFDDRAIDDAVEDPSSCGLSSLFHETRSE